MGVEGAKGAEGLEGAMYGRTKGTDGCIEVGNSTWCRGVQGA